MRPYLLHQLLVESAERYPDRDAVAFQGRAITYSELNHRSNQVASALKELGVNPGDRVGILLRKSIESLFVLFGILKTGAAYVPIDYLSPPNRVEFILKRCEIRILFTEKEPPAAGRPIGVLGIKSQQLLIGGEWPRHTQATSTAPIDPVTVDTLITIHPPIGAADRT